MNTSLRFLTLAIIVVFLFTGLGEAQSQRGGSSYFHQAEKLMNNARSKADIQRGIQKYEKALQVFEKIGALKWIGVTSYRLGVAHENLGRPDKAVEYYEEALPLFRKTGHIQGEGVALNNLGNVYDSLGQYDKALEYYEKSLAIRRKIGDIKFEGQTLNNLGNVYYRWGQYDKAVEYYEKSLAIARKIGHIQGEGQTLNNLGGVYHHWGQYDKAVEYYKKSLAIKRKIGHKKGGAGTLNNLGNVHDIWGQYDKAVEYYEKSLAIARKIGDIKYEGQTLNNLGNVYSRWGQYDKAVEYYEKSLNTARKIGDIKVEGVTLGNLGNVYEVRNDHKKALALFKKCLAINKKIGIPTDGPNKSIGMLYLASGDISEAEQYIQKADSIGALGLLYLAKADYAKAKECYDKVRKSAVKSRNADDLFRAYTGLGLANERMENYKEAERYYAKGMKVVEDIRSSLQPAQRKNFYAVKIGGFYRTEPYEGWARVLIQLGRSIEAFRGSEYTKARMFAEAMSRSMQETSFDVPAKVIEKDEAINNQLSALKRNLQMAYEKKQQQTIDVLASKVQEMELRLQAHIKKLRKQYPLFAATKYPEPMDLSESALKPEERALVYDVTDSGTLIYITQGKKIVKALFKEISREDLDSLIRRFREPMEIKVGQDSVIGKLESFDFEAGYKLYELLVQEAFDHIPEGKAIIIVPDDSLGVLPFEMLPLTATGEVKTDKEIPYVSGAKFLEDRNPVSYSQSITALTLARTLGSKKRKADKVLVLADPVFEVKDARSKTGPKKTVIASAKADAFKSLMVAMQDGKQGTVTFPRLPMTEELAEGIKGIYKSKSEILTGMAAAKDSFMSKIAPKLQNYDKVVFATHGYYGSDIPIIQEPVLVLTLVPPGTDGYLKMSEVMGLKMNADIVALTACQTGLGKRISGEGTMGMGRAFQYAGAKSVLMSMWSVSEESSVKLVESFFKHLESGKSKIEALRHARIGIRKAGFDHPFFWSSFILAGETGMDPEITIESRAEEENSVSELTKKKEEQPNRFDKAAENDIRYLGNALERFKNERVDLKCNVNVIPAVVLDYIIGPYYGWAGTHRKARVLIRVEGDEVWACSELGSAPNGEDSRYLYGCRLSDGQPLPRKIGKCSGQTYPNSIPKDTCFTTTVLRENCDKRSFGESQSCKCEIQRPEGFTKVEEVLGQ